MHIGVNCWRVWGKASKTIDVSLFICKKKKIEFLRSFLCNSFVEPETTECLICFLQTLSTDSKT